MSGKKRAAGRNWRIDAFRVAAALLIVAIHTSPLMVFSETADLILTRVIARVAVPFFFMVTGYFVLPRCLMPGRFLRRAGNRGRTQRPGGYFWNYERKQLGLYAFAILLYLPVNWYAGNLKGPFGIPDVARELLFEGTFYHLWYLPGVILGLLLVYLGGRALSYGGVLVISLLLYLIGLGGDSYYGLVSQWEPAKAFYDWIFGISSYTRNGVFFAPVFLWLGYGLARMGILGEMERPATGSLADTEERSAGLGAYAGEMGLAASGVLMLAEAVWIHGNGWQRHDSMYFFLPAVMGFLFYLLVRETPGGREIRAGGRSPEAGAKRGGRGLETGARGSGGGLEAGANGSGVPEAGSGRAKGNVSGILPGLSLPEWTTWVYILHPIGIILVRGAAKAVKFMPLIENSLLHYAAVVLVSGCLAAGFCVAAAFAKGLWDTLSGGNTGSFKKSGKRSGKRLARRRRPNG